MHLPNRLQLANLPTPIIKTKSYFDAVNNYEVYIKRDDFTGVELSGNKVRKLNFLFKEAMEQGAGHVITCGGIQSNHCRATAFYATKLGLKVTLMLRGSEPEIANGNLLLDNLLGADIVWVTPEEYKDADQRMAEIAKSFPEKGYVIPEGGSNETGAWGYLDAFNEIIQQDDSFDTIVLASGSGGTHAGLLLGKLISNKDINIYSVNVCDDRVYFQNKIDHIMQNFCKKYDYNLNWKKEDINILDGYVGKGYAQIGQTEVEAIRNIAQSEGIIMDPVYGIKAILGLQDNLNKGNIAGQKILFIHTGGIFGLFAYASMFD